MTSSDDPGDVYRALGVTPAINASGTTTKYGGTKLRPEVMETMNRAATVMVDPLGTPRDPNRSNYLGLLSFNAEIELHPAMSLEDLEKAGPWIAEAVDKYG